MKRLVCAVLAFALGSAGAGAAATQSSSDGYAVRAVLPDNQLDDSALYFDLKIAPGQSQTLQVVVFNRAAEEIEVSVEANAALTNANGVIEFEQSEERDASMAVDFTQIVTPIESVIKVPARGEAIAEFALNAPEEPFEGTVFGGLMFTKLHQVEDSEGGGGMAIRNVYRYVIGVRLRQDMGEVEPAFELLGAEIGEASRPVLLLHLRNPQPLIARKMSLVARVYAQDGDDALFTFEREKIAMAPNSSMSYALRFENDAVPLDAGEYRVEVELQFGDRSWQFEAPLEIN